MRCLALTQPWASLVACGAKRVETRSRPTSHRGDLAIQASKSFPVSCRRLCEEDPFRSALAGELLPDEPWKNLPRGVIVAVVEVVECFRFSPEIESVLRSGMSPRMYDGGSFALHEADFGDYSKGRYGYVMTNVRRLREPVPVKGMLGIFTLADDVRVAVERQLTSVVT